MASGMEMMLKSLGLDPTAIKTSIENFGKVVIALKEQMDRIEKQNTEILDRLGGPELPKPETVNGKEIEQ